MSRGKQPRLEDKVYNEKWSSNNCFLIIDKKVNLKVVIYLRKCNNSFIDI